LAHPEIEQHLDYLWEFIGLGGDPDAFGHWSGREPLLTGTGLGDPYPPGFEVALAAAGVPANEFRPALQCCTEVLYTNLFGAANEAQSRQFLHELAAVALSYGAAWPNLERFAGSRWVDGHGWGRCVSAKELAQWRLIK
jgi:hypothetical protein